ncbi:NDR1/HIN1-like protein 13 [Glycine soja]
MTNRVYPSAKPTAINGGAANPSFLTTKAQLYSATHPTYCPQPHHRHGVAGKVFYLLYHRHHPTFIVTPLKLSYLNLTSSSNTLNSHFDINFSTTNPNKKIFFAYNPTFIVILCDDINVDDNTVPSFQQPKKNTTLIKASILSSGHVLQSDKASCLKSSMKSSAQRIPFKSASDPNSDFNEFNKKEAPAFRSSQVPKFLEGSKRYPEAYMSSEAKPIKCKFKPGSARDDGDLVLEMQRQMSSNTVAMVQWATAE